ncbi:hypothetical protein MHB71_04860 [Paenibacillus sp. FSL H7-0940]|uniref:hypothetical protein n=1 Tax=Paenibacillus sp. FSL H7-0940 TaxID=2921443 RepID=UPI0030EF0E97
MAKLNVVIPAVEVTVGDVTYRKVDRKAQAGDIVKALKNEEDITGGAFYAVQEERGRHTFYDNENDSRPVTLRDCPELFEVYAPISEPATQPQTDTITFEGATWRKVDRVVREGDAIKFTDEDRSSYLTEAELYVVNEVDFNSDPHITDDDEDSYDAGGDDYEVYEKVAGEKAQEYREVKRKANVGERIKIVAAEQSGGLYEDGEEYVVSDADRWNNGRAVSVRGVNNAIYHREYVVLEPVTMSAEPTKPERLAVGDYARYVRGGSNAMVTGDIVEITEVDRSFVPYRVKRLTDGNTAWAPVDKLIRATDEEVAAVKDPRSQFAAGDKVRLVSGGKAWPLTGFEDGEVYTVSNPINSYHKGTRVEIKTGGLRGFALPSDIVKLTAAEIAEIERKQAEEAAKRAEETKWNAIGRKVNEYKRGDIVEIIRKHDSFRGVGTVEDGGDDGNIGVRMASKAYVAGVRYYSAFEDSGDTITLIVPVEQRFDREVDAA